jgi:hypothetical protein
MMGDATDELPGNPLQIFTRLQERSPRALQKPSASRRAPLPGRGTGVPTGVSGQCRLIRWPFRRHWIA